MDQLPYIEKVLLKTSYRGWQATDRRVFMELHLNLGNYNSESQIEERLASNASTSSQSSSLSTQSSQLTNLISGQILNGEIIQINGNEVQLLLENQQTILAKLEQELSLSIGQSITFIVKSNNGKQIALTPLNENLLNNLAATKAIEQAQIPCNERSIAMVNTMMEKGMPIDRNSLQAMVRIVYTNDEIPSKTIVEMTNLELPITNENAGQFEKYLNHQHQIVDQMDELTHGYIELFEQGDQKTKQSVLDIFWGTTIEQEKHATKMDISQIDVIPKTDEILEADEVSKINETKDSEGALARLFPKLVRNQIADALFEMGLDQEKCAQIKSGNMLPTDVLKHMNAILIKPEIQLKNSFISLLNSKEMVELLKEGIQKEWTLEPKDVEDKERIQDFYKKILNETDRTEKLLAQLEKSDSPLMKSSENLRTNVSFMNQMNQVYNYVQLPLKMSGENCHGDFYVFRNKKKQTSEDGSISALLHLEMERLGTVDVHVTLKDGNQVKTHFYLEKDELLDFMEEHIHILDERLIKKGYHMSTNASVRKRDENGNHTDNAVIDEMFPNDKNSTSVVKYSFDMRA